MSILLTGSDFNCSNPLIIGEALCSRLGKVELEKGFKPYLPTITLHQRLFLYIFAFHHHLARRAMFCKEENPRFNPPSSFGKEIFSQEIECSFLLTTPSSFNSCQKKLLFVFSIELITFFGALNRENQ